MKRHIVSVLFVALGATACGSSTSILNDPSTLSEYPCGDPHLAWCPGHKTCCLDGGREVCEMTGNDAGTCEDTAPSVDTYGAHRHRPQIVAAR